MTNSKKELAQRFEGMEQEDVERLSAIDRIIYTLYWVVRYQSSPIWHHQRNENGCLGCLNTVNSAINELNALDGKLRDAALDFAKKHDEELNALKNRMVERP